MKSIPYSADIDLYYSEGNKMWYARNWISNETTGMYLSEEALRTALRNFAVTWEK
jgi:hypothetical protein